MPVTLVFVVHFTEPRRAIVLERTRAGDPIPRAAEAAGVSGECVKKWLRIGRLEASGPRADFARSMLAARVAARQLAPASEAEMTPEEFRSIVESSVRKGVVASMRIWAALYATPAEAEPAPVSAIARLAAGDPVSGRPDPDPELGVDELASRRHNDPDAA